MKRSIVLVILAVSVFLISGCLQVETTIRIRKDGSGTVEQKFLMQSDIMQFLIGIAPETAESEGEAEGLDFGFITEEDLRSSSESMGEGVTLVRVEAVEEDGFEGYFAVYAFRDINTLRVNQNPGETLPSDPQDGGATPEEYIGFSYRNGVLEIDFPDFEADGGEDGGDGDSPDEEMDESSIEMFREVYATMKLGMYLVFEDGIAKTDATYRDGDTITLMELDFAKVVEDESVFLELVGSNPETVQEMKSLVERVPGIKIETAEKVRVTLR